MIINSLNLDLRCIGIDEKYKYNIIQYIKTNYLFLKKIDIENEINTMAIYLKMDERE